MPPLVSGWFPREKTREKRAQISIPTMRHYQDLSSASDWSCRVGNLLQPISGTTQIWVVTHRQYGARFSEVIFAGKPVVTSRNFGSFLWLGLIMLNNETTNKSDDGWVYSPCL